MRKRHPKTHEFLDKIRETRSADYHHPLLRAAPTNVSTLHGGAGINLTPDLACATLDIRTVPGLNAEEVLNNLFLLAMPGVILEICDDKSQVITYSNDPFGNLCQKTIKVIRSKVRHPGDVSYFSGSRILAPALGVPRAIIGPSQKVVNGQ